MQDLVTKYLKQFRMEHRFRRRMAVILAALACVVSLGVYWQLKLTGAALTNETYCGLEEHTHSEDCYESVLICGLEEAAATEGHTHTADCYETVTTLICGLEETEGVSETSEGSETGEGASETGKGESAAVDGHVHTEACYQTEQVLICGLEETEPTKGHTHTDACYEEVLVCGLTEHTHTVECLTDETADVESASDWEATLPSTLSGTWADDLVSVAESQVGYTESTANFKLDEDGLTRKGYTRYGAWAGNAYGDWDALFVSFCLHYAGISAEDFPESTGAYAWAVKLKELGLYQDAADGAAAGDLVFLDADADGKIDRVGIVIAVDEENDGQLTVIEGDYAVEADGAADLVCVTEYAGNDGKVVGFGAVAAAQKLAAEAAETKVVKAAGDADGEDAEGESAEVDAEGGAEAEDEIDAEAGADADAEIVLTQQTLTAETDGTVITVSGLLPEDAYISAEPVNVEIEGQRVLLAFDISIIYLDEEENEVIYEPEDGSVTVTIESAEITGGNDVYYVPEEGEPEKLENEAEEGSVAFEAEHFSVYAVTSSDTVEVTGTIDNAEGTSTITWTVYKNSETGERTLVISGEGSIPDYTSGTLTPWYSYCNTTANTVKLVIEEGITVIGEYAFHQSYVSEVSFPDTLTSIGKYAFCYSRSLTSVTIPDSVTFIGTYAFSYSHLEEINLGNGVQTIESFAFYATYSGSGITIYIPDSLTSLGADAFNQACAYEVSSTNTNFKVIDGVLYSYDGTKLIDFPKYKVLDTYTVPSEVTTIATGALRYVLYVNSLVIDHAVTFENSAYSMSNSNYQSIYLADGIEITGNAAFITDPNLSELRLPEETRFTFNVSCLGGDSSLTYLKIPDGTTSLQNQSLQGMTGLETLYYDATNASSIASNVFGGTSGISYDLIVGTSVDTLPVGFNYLAVNAETLNFEGPNALYVTEGALANAPAPFTGISGYIYVDEYGAVYQLDVDNDTATLIYVPDDVTEYTVPTSFTVSGESDSTVNATYNVTTVASDALKYADSLTSITFEDASQVTLESYALANCETLTSVTNSAASESGAATTVTAAEALGFASVGKNAFYNTGLGSGSTVIDETALTGSQTASAALSSGTSEQTASVSATVTDGGTWTANTDGTGGYVALTGQTMTVNINASNTSGSAQTYRVYFNVTDDDFQMNYAAGQTFTIASGTGSGNVSVICVQDPDDPYTFYYEFTLDVGQTVNFNVTTNYLSGSSDGGGLIVSTAIMETTTDDDGNTTVTGTTTTSASTLQLWWKTERDNYTLTKTNNYIPTGKKDEESQETIEISADENGVYLASNLQYTITLSQDEDKNSSLGEDYVTSVEYTDVITLPAGVEWDSDVLAAIKSGSYTRSTGNTTTFSVNGTTIVTLAMTANSGLALQKAKLSVNEKGQVVLTWTVKNISSANLYNNTFNLTIDASALDITLSSEDETVAVFDADTYATVSNTVSSTVHYTYSDDVESEDSANKTLTVTEGEISVSKSAENSVTYFGEDLTYTVSVYNSGATDYTYTVTEEGDYTLTDTLPDMVYIKAENMETMFKAAAEMKTPLTITITGAVLGTGGTVSDADDSGTAFVNSGNSDLTDETSGNTIVITYDSTAGTYTIAVTDADGNDVNVETATGADLESLLQGIGYGVTRSAVYTCTWTLTGNTEYTSKTETTTDEETGEETTTTTTANTLTLKAGQTLTYSILSTVKTTFQYLQNSDWPTEYPSSYTVLFTNTTAQLNDPNGKQIKKTSSVSKSVKREAKINKAVYDSEGNDLSSALAAEDGEVLTYALTFTHYGDGTYDDLPMVDDLYGSQYLLVPVTGNSENASITSQIWTATEEDDVWSGTGVTTYTDSTGTQYYVLGTGSYTNVIVGSYTMSNGTSGTLVAAEITVTYKDEEQDVVLDGVTYSYTGVHTEIKWYFDELEGGNYTLTVNYQALVDYGSSPSYTLGNVVWMNDRTGSRIYASLWGGGTIINWDKEIVTSDEDTTKASDDVIDEDDLSEVGAGETVTYRLTLYSTGDAGTTFTLNGANIADALPGTYGTFEWSKTNVSVTGVVVEASGDGNGVTNADALKDSNNWDISDSWNNLTSEGQYYILWNDSMNVVFTGTAKVYIYVTLTFPADESTTDDEGNVSSVWEDYVQAVGGTTLSNTFYVYRNPAVVNHILKEEGNATLTKGVYALARSNSDAVNTSQNITFYATGSSKDYYNNQDSNYRYIYYYVELYNGAYSRLYINDLYDLLPEGFTYVTMIRESQVETRTDGALDYLSAKTNVITTKNSSENDAKWLIDRDDDVTYMSATVSAGYDKEGTLIFTISAGSGTYAIKYDEEMGQYYLDSNESIVFGFICQIGEYTETEDDATNTIAMSYTDYTGAGNVNVDEEHDASGRDFTVGGTSQYSGDKNDGVCEVKNTTDMGIDDGTGNTQWLVSDVTVSRGGIVPGVSKKTTSWKLVSDNDDTEYTTSVTPGAIVNWESTLSNSGTMTIYNYTVTDVMPSPFVFTGDVTYSIVNSSGTITTSGTLFSFPDVSDLSVLSTEDKVTISYTKPNGSAAEEELIVGGDAVTLQTQQKYGSTGSTVTAELTLKLYLDDSGNVVMEIGFTDIWWAIPEGGYVTLDYSSYNPSGTHANATYINTVTLTPNSQEFTAIQSGKKTSDGTGVYATSPVTVATGFSTNAYKSVTEKTDETNSAYSYDSDNSIVLSSADSIFTYTLTVENTTNTEMNSLVLIDNLPYVGDTYTFNTDVDRGSEFAVELASTNFTVYITTSTTDETTGETTTTTTPLDSQYYTVQGSIKQNNFSADDKAGTSTSDWFYITTENLSTVKSIRVVIHDYAIPAGATVSVCFDGKVSGTADAGAIAWNNFGYTYSVTSGDSTISLEAMPLEVGVQVPSAPELEKKLVDLDGSAYMVSEDTTFTFVVYEGSELKDSEGNSYTSMDALITALGETKYKEVTITVKAGASNSGSISLSGDDWISWTWTEGTTYTIAEFLSDETYVFRGWSATNTTSGDAASGNSYTFTYDREKTLYLTCENKCQMWSLELTKVDAASYDEDEQTYSTTLNGAVFALYNRNNSNKTDSSAAATIEVDNETWYLYDVQTTDINGTLSFTGLTEDSYYLVEVKAPDGYNLSYTSQVISRETNVKSVTVENTAGYELPVSGGIGTRLFGLIGLTLCSAAALLLFRRRKAY